MNAQQLHDYIIKPTLKYMGGNYSTPEARLLLLATAAIESDCGYYIKQVNGPALGIWQMEPGTFLDIRKNCDAFNDKDFKYRISNLVTDGFVDDEWYTSSLDSCKLACAMARLKYSMDSEPLPEVTGKRIIDERSFYDYYKRVYNTYLGASTFLKWQIACEKHNIFEVKL